jgi:WD40 repeat protein
LASGGDDHTVKLWSLPEGRLVRSIRAPSNIRSLLISGNGAFLIAADFNGHISLWSLPSGKPVKVWAAHQPGWMALALHPQGTFLASWGDAPTKPDADLKIWSLPKGELVSQHKAQSGHLRSAVISADGSLLVMCGMRIELRSLPSGDLVRTLNAPGAAMVVLGASNTVVARSRDVPELPTWRLPSGEPGHTIPVPFDSVESMAASPHGTLLVLAGYRKSQAGVAIVSLPSGEVLQHFEIPAWSARPHFVITPNNEWLVGTGFADIYLWSIRDRDPPSCMFDPAATLKNTRARSVRRLASVSGPCTCDSVMVPLEAKVGGLCTCDTVAVGTWAGSRGGTRSGSSGGHYWRPN